MAGIISVNFEKMNKIINGLEDCLKGCNDRYFEFFDREINGVIRSVDNEHENFLSNAGLADVFSSIESKYNLLRDELVKWKKVIDNSSKSIHKMEEETGKKFSELSKTNILGAYDAVSSAFKNSGNVIKVSTDDGEGSIYYTVEGYREKLEEYVNAKVSNNGVNTKSSSYYNSADSGAFQTFTGVTATSTVVTAGSTLYQTKNDSKNESVDKKKPSTNSSNNNIKDNVSNNKNHNSNNSNNNITNNNHNSNSNNSTDNKNDNKLDNNKPNINIDPGHVDSDKNTIINKNDNIVKNDSSSNTSKPSNNNSTGFGSMFNKNDDYKTPDISTSVGNINEDSTLSFNKNDDNVNKPSNFGNIFDNDNTSSSSTVTSNTSSKQSSSGGFNPIPLGVGLGLATAAGVGAKVIYDHKKNSEFDNDEQVESFGGNKFWSDDDLSVIHSEEDSFANNDLDRFDNNEQADLPSSYSASYSNDVDSQIPDNNMWSLEDDLNNNEQIVDLLNGN